MDSPAKISHNYAQLCKCLDNQPIKITTRFRVVTRHWTALKLVDSDVTEGSKRLEVMSEIQASKL